ncbi:hypothetical protein [Archaeoglobus neptunius]|uniref:hypothetical protein n=1 Tax=Archaeoglobus neptunius TaxID=2798580 RepID=UPI001928156E|nr:hypothetical protein [Archaeoglobus neptunius]
MSRTKKALLAFLFVSAILFGSACFVYVWLTGPFGPPEYVSAAIYLLPGNVSPEKLPPYSYPSPVENVTDVTVILPVVYVKDKPLYEYIPIRGEYRIVNTEHGKMLKIHAYSGLLCSGLEDVAVVEINKEVRISPSEIAGERVSGNNPVIRVVNYTVPVYTSENVTVVVSITTCSGISLFGPVWKGKKYSGCRYDEIVTTGKGWRIAKGTARVEMYFRKHWYDL